MKFVKHLNRAAVFVICAAAGSFPEAAIAQLRPLPLRLTTFSNQGTGRVIDVERLGDAESRFYWEGTTVDPAGYLRVDVPQSYLELVSGFAKGATPSVDVSGLAGKYVTSALLPRAELKESYRRTNLIFDTPAGLGMLTIWEFGADGAQVYRLQAFLNTQVGTARGTISLATSPGSELGLWKLVWISEPDNVQFELYVPDRLDAERHPKLSPRRILEFGTTIRPVNCSLKPTQAACTSSGHQDQSAPT